MEELGITKEEAQKLVDKHIKNVITKCHLLESEAIMSDLAFYLCQNGFLEEEEKGVLSCDEIANRWGVIGFLHDIDWDITKDDPGKHCIVARDILKKAGATSFLIETIQSHAWGKGGVPAFSSYERKTKLQHALAASETLTGLIVASALVQPDRKIRSVTLDSLKKKFKSKSFARGCSREIIAECHFLGIDVDTFLEIGLEALKRISDNIGL